EPDPLAPLRRRVERVVAGGRATLPAEVQATIARDAASLRAGYLPTCAAALLALAAPDPPTRDRAAAHATFAQRWLAASTAERAAAQTLAARRFVSAGP